MIDNNTSHSFHIWNLELVFDCCDEFCVCVCVVFIKLNKWNRLDRLEFAYLHMNSQHITPNCLIVGCINISGALWHGYVTRCDDDYLRNNFKFALLLGSGVCKFRFFMWNSFQQKLFPAHFRAKRNVCIF